MAAPATTSAAARTAVCLASRLATSSSRSSSSSGGIGGNSVSMSARHRTPFHPMAGVNGRAPPPRPRSADWHRRHLTTRVALRQAQPSASTSASASASSSNASTQPPSPPPGPPPSTAAAPTAKPNEPTPLAITRSPTSPSEDRVSPSDSRLLLTPRGARQLQRVHDREPEEGSRRRMALRVEVKPGGCHGYQYAMEITEEIDEEDDFVFQHPEHAGARLVVDSTSLRLLRGSTIDYATELIGSQFVIRDNPQAKGAGCGCGVSWEPAIDL